MERQTTSPTQCHPAARVGAPKPFDLDWLQPGRHRYALLNPLHVASSDRDDLDSRTLRTPSVKVRDPLLPQLICLEALSPTQREHLAKRIEQYAKRGRAFLSALLQSEADTEEVIRHFRFTLEQARPGSRRRWWLRCYDPRVFRHLCWLLETASMDRLLGPITCWRWPDQYGQWHALERNEVPDLAIRVPLLSASQWSCIDRMASLNAVIDRLAMLKPEAVASFDAYRALDVLLVQAQQIGLAAAEDCALYAEQAARFHPHIHDHPEMRRRLDQSVETQGSYMRRCEDLSAQSLLAMARELETIT
ncbi:DUF4123 domain-containing protein [Salinicola socius]|uniref:DUF4123 domain-containing protein n=1 Tax=Salinicola socius TaxID=404433 RepID=A0A1Q8SP77_9GAMM|nr:DUF4123 domain-containing protein [Salinicola socius]OLO03218.1 hypothetical protein BTW07_15295 [Salinicola socius]